MNQHYSNHDRFHQVEWLLEKRLPSKGQEDDSYQPYYGDVTKLNTNGLILNSLGKEILREIAEDAIDLLGTSVSIYESNGDYAFGMFSSGWCQLMDTASRKLCHIDDNRRALDCGRWLCHETCWNDSAKKALESGQITDTECVGGINLYAEPIYAGETIVGVINIGYGTPPNEQNRLHELADLFEVDAQKLKAQADSYDQRPQFLVDLAKKRLKTSAKIIGEIVKKTMLQKSLVQSEKKYRLIFENSLAAVTIFNNDYKLILLNEANARILGGEKADFIGKSIYELFPDVAEFHVDRFKTIIKERKCQIYEDAFKLPNGTFWFSSYLQPVFNKNEEVEGIQIISIDITDKKHAELELIKAKEIAEKNEIELRKVQAITHVGSWHLDVETNQVVWTEELYKMYGFDPNLPPPPYTEHMKLFTPESWDILSESLAKTRESGIPYELELRTVRKDKSNGWMWVRGEAIKDKNEKIISLWGAAQDISERKQLEVDLSSTKDFLDETGKIAKVGGWQIDLVSNRLAWTDETFRIHEVMPENQPVLEDAINFYHPDDQAMVTSIVKKSISDGEPFDFESRLITKNDKQIWVRSKGYVVTKKGKNIAVRGIFQNISERKLVEEELIAKEAKFRSYVDNAPDGVFVANEKGEYLEVNRAASKITGYSEEELLNLSISDLLQPDDVEKGLNSFQELSQKGTIQSELGYLTKAGEKRFWYVDAVKLSDTRFLGFAKDITERKKAEQALKENEVKVRNIMENSINLFYSHTSEHILTYLSPQVKDILGYTQEEAMINWTQLVSDNLINDIGFRNTVKAIETGNRQPVYELEMVRKDGGKIWVEIRESPLIENGKVVSIVGSLTDVTERKQAEDTLRKSHERFLTVLNSIDATIYVADMQNYEVLFMNKYMINSFGRDMTGEVCWEAFRGESGKCSHCHNDQLIDENGKPTGVYSWQDQNPITGKWYINYDRAIEWTDGRLAKIQIATDITEMKHMENELRQTHKMESIGTLAGGIAHEFNNMLGIILGNTELALDDIPNWNPAKDSLKEIKTASLRAKDVVRKLLSVARKTPESRKPIQIGPVVKESLNLIKRTIPTTVEIRKNIACSTEMILGDTTEISQVVINLCTNSVHAMTEGIGVLEVGLDTKHLNQEKAPHYQDLEPGDYVRLMVKDTGGGIEPAFMDRLFDPYFTTKDLDQGLGMGLAVVNGIVKKHDGAIKVESEMGKGTTVEVLFPLIEGVIETRTEEIETLQMGTEKILLVDDEEMLAGMVMKMLERSGYEVVCTTSSLEALRLFKENPYGFDLVISDMAMPEMAGDRLAKEIIEILPEMKIILCTGYSNLMDERKAEELGINAFAMKPISKESLTKTVREVLDGYTS